MDPTENMAEQLRMAQELRAESELGSEHLDTAVRLAELVVELVAWVQKGGALPEQLRAGMGHRAARPLTTTPVPYCTCEYCVNPSV